MLGEGGGGLRATRGGLGAVCAARRGPSVSPSGPQPASPPAAEGPAAAQWPSPHRFACKQEGRHRKVSGLPAQHAGVGASN